MLAARLFMARGSLALLPRGPVGGPRPCEFILSLPELIRTRCRASWDRSIALLMWPSMRLSLPPRPVTLPLPLPFRIDLGPVGLRRVSWAGNNGRNDKGGTYALISGFGDARDMSVSISIGAASWETPCVNIALSGIEIEGLENCWL